jgi:site-specific recombinase XerD
MAYAEKRGDKLTGRWIGRARVKAGTFQRTFDTKKAAEGYETYCKLMGEEPPTLSGGTGVTFKEAADACRAAGGAQGKWKHGRDPSVLARLDYVVDVLGAHDITAIDRGMLEKLVDNLSKRRISGKPISGATINRYLHAVSSVLTYALKRGWITTKPDLPKQRDSNARQLTVAPETERVLLGYMRGQGWHREALCVSFLAASGLREGELYKLAPEQIGNDSVRLFGDQTKNNKPRVVYVAQDLCRDMRALIASGAMPKAYLLRRKFKKACKACGQPEGLVIHSLRHTTATRLLAAGVDLQVTQEIMGHLDIRTTLKYRHVAEDMKREAAKKLEAMCGQPAPDTSVVPFSLDKKSA